MKRTCQAIISSTKDDLASYRMIAKEVLEKAALHVLNFESSAASSREVLETPWSLQESLNLVQRADIYVGIIAHRYGTVLPGQTLSLTEIEYNRAEELNLRRLMFIIADDQPWLKRFIDDGEAASCLRRFQERILQLDGVERFTNEQEFGRKLAIGIARWQRETASQAIPGEDARRLQSISELVAERYAQRIANWFAERFERFAELVKDPRLNVQDTEALEEGLQWIWDQMEGINSRTEFRGGFYCLNAEGLVLGHYVPYFPRVNIRNRFNAFDREYFQLSLAAKVPIVCNSLTSADRKMQIIVMAVPRFDHSSGKWSGIFDAVIDVPDAPFNDIAADVAGSFKEDSSTGLHFELMLLDDNGVVLGSLNTVRSSRSFEGHPCYSELRKNGKGPNAGYGYSVGVSRTPFHTVALWIE
jgi:Domain of unknown function (DUF4062)